MFKILNRKLKSCDKNISKKKYHKYLEYKRHKYLEEYNFFMEQSIKLHEQIERGEDNDGNIAKTLTSYNKTGLISKRAYNLLKKIDENQEILKSDYDDKLLEIIELDKEFNYCTPKIYAKFDKFKITTKHNE